MDPGLLASTDTDSLTVLNEAYGVGLGILQSDESDHEIDLLIVGNVLLCSNNICKAVCINNEVISSLLESYAEYLLCLDGIGNIIGIHLEDAVCALSL